MTQENRFECPDCEMRCDRRYISYDPLGYPICPVCSTSTVPSNSGDRGAA